GGRDPAPHRHGRSVGDLLATRKRGERAARVAYSPTRHNVDYRASARTDGCPGCPGCRGLRNDREMELLRGALPERVVRDEVQRVAMRERLALDDDANTLVARRGVLDLRPDERLAGCELRHA